MSIGRISSFLDVYIERDMREGKLDEAGAQELWDQLVQKLRIVRFLRTPTTTPCSAATRTGRRNAWAEWIWMAARW
jgi:pyruvate-formate lyase